MTTTTPVVVTARLVPPEHSALQGLDQNDHPQYALGTLLGPDQPVRLSRFQTLHDGKNGHNGFVATQDNTTLGATYGDSTQYTAWWRTDGKVQMAVRTLPNGAWTETQITDSTFQSVIGDAIDDDHNGLAVAVDTDGYVHVSGNMHDVGAGSTLRYVRTTNPGDLSAWTQPAMIGTEEGHVTYPAFVRLPDGTLLYFYRDGTAGHAGGWCCNRYNVTAKTWARIGGTRFIEGIDSGPTAESPYPWRWVADSNGDVHTFWTWRQGAPGGIANQDLSYAKLTTLTGTMTAKNADGTSRTLPLSHTNCEKILTLANYALINSGGADVDDNLHPHAGIWHQTGTPTTQLAHVYYDGAAWQQDIVTSFAENIDLATWPTSATNGSQFSFPLARPSVWCHAGRTYMTYRTQWEGQRDEVQCLDVTPGEPVRRFPILGLPPYDWEATFDSRAWAERGEMHIWIGPCVGQGSDSPAAPYFNNADNWSQQFAGILSLDPDRVELLAARIARIPRIKVVSSSAGNVALTTSATVSVPASAFGPLIIPEYLAGKLVFARMAVRMRSQGSGYQAICAMQTRIGGTVIGPPGTNPQATLETVLGVTTTAHFSTPWVPIPASALIKGDTYGAGVGYVQALAYATSANPITIDFGSIELGILEH